jgi:acetyl esterase
MKSLSRVSCHNPNAFIFRTTMLIGATNIISTLARHCDTWTLSRVRFLYDNEIAYKGRVCMTSIVWKAPSAGVAVLTAVIAAASAQVPQAGNDWEQRLPKNPVGAPMVYKTVDAQPLHAYVLQPSDSRGAHPAIVFFHGGGWTSGSVTQFNKQMKALAARGIVAVDVEYRLIPKAKPKEGPEKCVEDAKSAMRWVRANAVTLRVDPDRIVASGGSAGGYLAAAVAFIGGWNDPQDDRKISPKPEALVLFFPVLDVTVNAWEKQRFPPEPDQYNPMALVNSSAPPTLIEAGGADKLVRPEEVKHYKERCDAVGAKCIVDFYDGQPHGFANNEPYNSITLNATMHFLATLGYLPKDTPDVVVPDPKKNTTAVAPGTEGH